MSRPDNFEAKSALDSDDTKLDMYSFKCKNERCYCWRVTFKTVILGTGIEAKKEVAAEAVYRCFYNALTRKKFADARTPHSNCEIVVFGNWITNQQFMDYPHKNNLTILADANEDDRENDNLFVIGYPVLGKQKATVRAWKVKKSSSWGELTPENCIVTLHSGFELNSTMDWYVKRPEHSVLGEVMCFKCHTIGVTSDLDMRYVRGTGPLCAPCVDRFCTEAGDDDQYD